MSPFTAQPQNVPALLAAAAARYPEKPALLHKVAGRYVAVTFAEFADRIARCAGGLLRLNVHRGDRVAVLGANGPTWVIADLGIQATGAITVPIHPTFSSALMQFVLSHAGARVLVVGAGAPLPKLQVLLPELTTLEHLVVEGDYPTPPLPVTVHAWREFLAAPPAPLDAVSPQDPASIVYTSGTTGLPKGVVLTHGNFLANVAAALRAVPFYPADTLLSFLPLSHVLERTAGYYVPLSIGATVAYAESPARLMENLQEVRPTILISVPRIFEKFHDAIWAKVKAGRPSRRRVFTWALRQPHGTWRWQFADRLVFRQVRAALGGQFRLTISGGASLHVPLLKFFDRLGVEILEGYGLTETAPVVSVNTATARRFGSVGKPLPGVEVKIAPDKEILVRGPNVCAGYWQDEAATRELVNSAGWLHTGDLGFLDADGFLFIIGRRKEMLVTAGGKNVWPTVLENQLNADRLIVQSMVVGHGRPYLAALVVPTWPELEREAATRGWPADHGQLIAYPAVLDLYRERIAKALTDRPDFERVRRFTLLPDEFSAERDELTPTLKLRRLVIERHCAKAIAALYLPNPSAPKSHPRG